MNKIGWKVVRENADGAFVSALNHGTVWSCQYAVGQRTVGRAGTPVLAFRTRKAARKFALSSAFPVFRARLENSRRQKCVAVPWCSSLFEAFWAGGPQERRPAPDGTLACDAITLLERA